MNSIRKIIERSSSPLTINLPKEYEKGDLSDFFGKLQWKGDALEEQKKLRNEWN